MRWYYIVGGLLLLPLLLLLLRVGVEYRFGEESLTLRLGPLRKKVPLSGAKKKAEKQETAKKTPAKSEKPQKPKPKIGFEELRGGASVLWPALKKALGRTRRSVRIHPLQLHVIIAGYDPAETAKLYGWAQALLWSVMPEAERLLVIPDPHIRLDTDFEGTHTRCEGTVGLSIRIGSVLIIAMTVLVPALRWYRSLPQQTAAAAETQQQQENDASAAQTADGPADKPGENTTRGE